MKIFIVTSTLIVCGLSSSLSAQKGKNSTAQPIGQITDIYPSESKQNDVKAKFVNSQDYLFPANAKIDNRRFGDSLKGFDEAAAKIDFLNRGFSGSEFFFVMNSTKREYINSKYQIGARFVKTNQQNNQTAGRPGSGSNFVNLFPCVNEDFELTSPGVYSAGNAVAGWTIESGINPVNNPVACNINSPNWVAGSAEFSIMTTPILGTPWNGIAPFSIDNVNISQSPLGGNNIARLQNSTIGNLATRMRTTFPVTTSNTLFQFAYAGSWDGTGHQCCDQPSFNIRLYNCQGNPLPCSSVSLTPSGPNCTSGVSGYTVTGGISWTNWVVNYIDLTPYIGSCVTIEIVNSDCNGGAHHGSAFFDARCGGPLVPGCFPFSVPAGAVSFCSGSNQALITAPLGYASYQWYGPNPGNLPTAMSPTLGGNTPALTVLNPVPGTVYTVGLVTAAGCSLSVVDTIQFTTVSIVGLGTRSTCPGGASGSATVQGFGSGTGYNYTWTPAGTTSVISTASTVSGLSAGVYSVTITGFGAAACGSAVATVTIGISPPNTYTVIKPFCGNEAYLSSQGSNFQWYKGLTAISASLGGTAAGYTVTSPYNGQSFWLTYTSPQNCRDSVNFILSQTPAGYMYVTNTTYACPNTANASARVVMTPASGAPPGINAFSVFSISGPSYTSGVSPTTATSYTPLNMPAGTYSVTAFDGSCKYNATFVINDYVYSYAVSPTSGTLCPGNTTYAGVSFPTAIVPGQYNFSWSPSTYIVGGALNTSNISVQISPSIPINSVITTIYSITVVPAVVNCPITKTISVTAANLQIPTITAPQPFCNNALGGPKTITVSPMGTSPYTFSSGMFSFVNSSLGTFNSTAPTVYGTNTFVVSTSVGTCAVSNSGSFNISKFNTAALSGSVVNQCSTYPPVNLMGIVQSQINGVWSGLGVSGNFFNPNLPTGVYVVNYNTTSSPDPALCPDTRTIAIATSQTVTPFITPEAPFCTNKPTFNMSVSPPGGNWSGGPPLFITPGGVVNPVMANLGNNLVTYVVNTGACVNTATTILNATTFRSAALTASISNLCKNSAAINLMGIVQNPSGAWSGCGVTNNVFSPQQALASPACQNPLSPGFFTLTYNNSSTPNPLVCPDVRSIVVYVLDPVTPTIGITPPHCSIESPFQIVVTPNTGSFTPTSYLTWDGWYTPSLSPLGNNMVQYTIGTNTCNAQSTRVISIEQFVPPTLVSAIPDLCITSPGVNLSAITLSNSGIWTGAGVVGSTFNPDLSGTGSIVLSYNTSSQPSGLCPAQSTLAVKVYSVATPFIEEEGPFCNSQAPIKLRVNPIGGIFTGMNNNAVDVMGHFAPSAALIGDNIINYSITAGPCVAYGQTVIKIEKFISADFSKQPGPYCRNEKAIDFNSLVQNPGGAFSGPGLSGSLFTPKNANIGNNNIIVYQTHSWPTASLCPHTTTVRVQVNNTPDIQITSTRSAQCVPVEVLFNTPSVNSGKGEWILGDGSEPKIGLTANHTYTASGTYSVVFNYWDNLGCVSQTTLGTPVTAYELPKAAFSYGPYNEDLTISNPEVHFTNLSSDLKNNSYEWKMSGLPDTKEIEPVVTFPSIGRYEITLTATNIHTCSDKTTQILEIKNDFGIYIPNSFTPNEDGLNDVFVPVFTPFGLDTKTFDMEIFNRWGTSLYHTKDITKGWNGSIQNRGTEALKSDVYTYKIRYQNMEGVVYNTTGGVNLVK